MQLSRVLLRAYSTAAWDGISHDLKWDRVWGIAYISFATLVAQAYGT